MRLEVKVRCKVSEIDKVRSKVNLHDDDVIDIVVTDTGLQWNERDQQYHQVRKVNFNNDK